MDTTHRFPSAQKALVYACAKAAQLKRIRREREEWEQLKARAEAEFEDAQTLTRLSPEVTAVARMRERVYLAGARRQLSAYERARFARQG